LGGADRAARTVPLVGEMQTLTITTICRALLSVGVESEAALRFAQAVRESLYFVRRKNTSMCPMPHWVPSRTNRSLRETRDVLDAFVSSHLRPRLEPGAEKRDDIVQQMIEARDPETGAGMPWQALLDETKTLFTAGFETTATTLAWALHRLSHHEDIAERLASEVYRELGDRRPAFEDLPRLSFASQVAQETMRLYPPVYTFGRTCVTADELGGFAINPGDVLLASCYGAHRMPEYWPTPERFDPDRFALGQEWPKHAYMPFGMGKHLCIGNTFALHGVTLALAMIAQRYRLRPLGPLDVPARAQVTLVPAREILVRLERRAE
jgi:cytochrome P450